jgi:hypothetical protein
VISKFDVLVEGVEGVRDETMTTILRTANDLETVMQIAQNRIITNGKKTFPTEGCKYGVKLICGISSKTRLKTLATDFAIVELA